MLSGSKRLGTTCLETPILWKQKDFLTQLGLPWGNKESVAWNQDNVIVRLCISDKYFKSCLRRNIKFVLYKCFCLSPACLSLALLSVYLLQMFLSDTCLSYATLPLALLSLCALQVFLSVTFLSNVCHTSVTCMSPVCHLSVSPVCQLPVTWLSN